MPEHRHEPGRTLIDGLVALGRGLGYHVRPENPVRKIGQNFPAVDVAWMADDLQEFPLMIFEVESTAGNTIANNAVKVFGQSNEQFEKPLFFFHAVLESGKDTSRIDSLRALFGLNNYRLYRLDRDERTKLIRDILSQHRRLKRDIDLPALRGLLLHPAWVEVSPGAIFDHVEDLQFRCPYLNSYATFALREPTFMERFVRRLAQQEGQPFRDGQPRGYQTFIGQHCSRPIHLAVLARAFPEKVPSLIVALRNWQERAPLMPQIAPFFGLHRDYDDFLICIAPGLLASIAAIFGHLEARAYLAGLIESILKELGRTQPRFSFYNAVWLLHTAAGLPDPGIFDFARGFINKRGGISRKCLFHPPFQVPGVEDCPAQDFPWNVAISENPELVPDRSEFRVLVSGDQNSQPAPNAPLALAVKLLTEQEDLDGSAPEAVNLLVSRA